MKRHPLLLAIGLGAAALPALAQHTLEDFSALTSGQASFAGTWEATGSLTGTATPQASLAQGTGIFSISGTGVTNDSDSYLEVAFATPLDLSAYSNLSVAAQPLANNGATSFEVRLFDTHGVAAFATFEVSAFSPDAITTVTAPLVAADDFDATAVEIMRLSGAQPAGHSDFKISFDEVAAARGASSFHDADTNQDSALDLSELLRVIQLYNTRFGTTRTGRYLVSAGTADGFGADATLDDNATVSLTRYHTADTDHNGKFSLQELLRVIQLYNFRSGTVRTGEYHTDMATSDQFAPGPSS